MPRKSTFDVGKLIRAERRRWQDSHLIGPEGLRDFQKLSDDAFRSMKGKYYRPVDLIAEMRSRRFFRLNAKRRTD